MAEQKINGRTFRVDHMPASEALALYADIMRVAGRAANRVPQIFFALTKEAEPQDGIDMADMVGLLALSDILEKTETAEVMRIVTVLVESAKIMRPSGNLEPVVLDADFSTGNLKDILAVVKFVMTVQYADFFTGSAGNGILGLLRTAFQSKK